MEDGYKKITQVNNRPVCSDPSWIHGPEETTGFSTDYVCHHCGYEHEGELWDNEIDGWEDPNYCIMCDSTNITYTFLEA